nr:uncharacterized protein LOC129388306 isoform X2 [Dermacentor andersoni]
MRGTLLLLLATIYFARTAYGSGEQNNQTKEHRKFMDGWTFFSRRMTYFMLRRTYDVAGGLENCMCVMAPFYPFVDMQNHRLSTTFTYQNRSSNDAQLNPGSSQEAFKWPAAKIRMQFSKAHMSISKTARGFNYAKSWIRTNKDCAVVGVYDQTILTSSHSVVAPNGTGVGIRPLCEVWASVVKNTRENELEMSSKWNLCLAYFYSNCDTRHLFKVYYPEKCKRGKKRNKTHAGPTYFGSRCK